MKRRLLVTFAAAFGSLLTPSTSAQNAVWIRQSGTSAADTVNALSADGSGGVYAGGGTGGALAGANAGLFDAWIARFDSTGAQLWIDQVGTAADDSVSGSAPDEAGGVYVCGGTAGDLVGANAGSTDVWFARFDSGGALLWLRQIGTNANDYAESAASDGSDGVYLCGTTEGSLGGALAGVSDAWLARYDGSGNPVWIRQIGTSLEDGAHAVARDGAGGVFVAGHTFGNLGGANAGHRDAWIARYDGGGNPVWFRQLGSSGEDYSYAVASGPSGGVYVAGMTDGSLGGTHAGSWDAWIAELDLQGNLNWIRQLGTSADDRAYALAADLSGGVYAIGWSTLNLGSQNAGAADAWVAHFLATGDQAWIRQLGTAGFDTAVAAAPDPNGGVYWGGGTKGDLAAVNAGNYDNWLARYDSSTPTPTTYCTAKLNSLGCTPAISISNVPSASAGSGCVLRTTNLIGAKNGLYFHSMSGSSSAPFHGGFLCVQAPTKRHAIGSSGAVAGTCAGVLSEDLSSYISSGADPSLVAGAALWLQCWSRDPGAATSDSLSDALAATIGL